MIPYGRQDISKEDIESVVSVLSSDFLTQGPFVPQFEEAIASHVGAKHAVAVNSATSALHIACLALDLGPGDHLWTTPITFVASANCGRYCGADVDFVDIDPTTYNMCPDALSAKLKQAKAEGRLPKVVIPVDMCGQSCDMEAIRALAVQYGFKIIEDASHAIGARYKEKFVGGTGLADITIFSFHPVKIITTAEGGVAVSDDPALAERMDRLRSHGITRDPELMTHPPDGGWYYQQIELGFNYRMTEMQAALGLSQMKRLDQFVAKRTALANRYDELLQDFPLVRPTQLEGTQSSWHLYVIQLDLDKTPPQTEVFQSMRNAGIGVNLHYIPVHTQPYYQEFGFTEDDFPLSNSYYERAMSIPLFAQMSEAQQDAVVTEFAKALGHIR